MSIDIDPALARQLEDKVRRGEFASVGDAVNRLLSLAIADEEPFSDAELAYLKPLIDMGLAEADRGEVEELDLNEIWNDVERRFAAESDAKVP